MKRRRMGLLRRVLSQPYLQLIGDAPTYKATRAQKAQKAQKAVRKAGRRKNSKS